MTVRVSAIRGHAGRRRPTWAAVALAALLCAANVPAQTAGASAAAVAPSPVAGLESLVSRIALYPDDLVAIVLPAATHPLQVVQAERFLEKRKGDPAAAIDDGWDAAVKSLLNYPEIVRMMSADLDWTSALGDAVASDQGEVLEAIQAFRRRTQSAGNLKSDAKQVVVVEKEVIRIVPADPQVIYVPQYTPATVVIAGGYASWGYWPSPYPVYYFPYPPGAALAAGLVWGAAIGAAWNGGHYVTHYGHGGNNAINISVGGDVNIDRSRTNVGVSTRPATTTPWVSTRQPVATSRPAVQAGAGAAARPALQGGVGAAVQPASQPAVNAFDGYGSARQTRLDSARGAASRSLVAEGRPSAAARPAPVARTGAATAGARIGARGGRR